MNIEISRAPLAFVTCDKEEIEFENVTIANYFKFYFGKCEHFSPSEISAVATLAQALG